MLSVWLHSSYSTVQLHPHYSISPQKERCSGIKMMNPGPVFWFLGKWSAHFSSSYYSWMVLGLMRGLFYMSSMCTVYEQYPDNTQTVQDHVHTACRLQSTTSHKYLFHTAPISDQWLTICKQHTQSQIALPVHVYPWIIWGLSQVISDRWQTDKISGGLLKDNEEVDYMNAFFLIIFHSCLWSMNI